MRMSDRNGQTIKLMALVLLLIGILAITASAWFAESLTPHGGTLSYAFAAGLTTLGVVCRCFDFQLGLGYGELEGVLQ